MKLFKQLSFFIVLFFSTFVYSSVQPIEIGLIGQNAEAIAGIKLAIKNINVKGGILNRPLALVLTPNNKATFNIIAGGNELLSQLPIMPNQKIFIATEVSLNQLPTNVITLTPNDQMQGIAAAQYISGRLYRDKAIVLYQANNASAHALANSFDETFSATGGAVLINSSWMTSISPEVIQETKQSNADIIYLVGDSESALAAITALRDANVILPIIGSNTYTSLIGSNQEVFFTSAGYYDPSFMEPAMIAFVATYKKEYGKSPKTIDAWLGYEAVQSYASAIQSTKSTELTKINEALHQPHQPSTVSVIKLYQNKVGIAAIIIPTLKGNHE
jgi:branched-chain amino acid transport system substrate-binding protein